MHDHGRVLARCAASKAGITGEGDDLASSFSRFVNQQGKLQEPLRHRHPSPLLSPQMVVAAQMDALQRNDYPELDAGVRVAYAFSKAADWSTRAPGKLTPAPAVAALSWEATERWLRLPEFQQLLHSPPFDVLINCDSWKAASNVVFPSMRMGNKAVQAVHVVAPRRPPTGAVRRDDLAAAPSAVGSQATVAAGGAAAGAEAAPSAEGMRTYTFTFCLERIDEGAFKGCFVTVGVRMGDYSL